MAIPSASRERPRKLARGPSAEPHPPRRARVVGVQRGDQPQRRQHVGVEALGHEPVAPVAHGDDTPEPKLLREHVGHDRARLTHGQVGERETQRFFSFSRPTSPIVPSART
jgi:hypothetical protein